ncbi:MAG: lamin tail domain-containing protein [candidate division Zixibacteria bacterium]|nr:lamin tail domain-containing protein [candidate division Zixibacteria bacterium]
MKMIISHSVLILALLTTAARAEIVISEVMANEPGNRILLEWVEIYNNGHYPQRLDQYRLIVNGDTLDWPTMIWLEPRAYVVLCRRLLPQNGSDCFEYRWGDSSGVWGDYELEHYQATEINISLPNSSGDIFLIDSLNRIIDECHWQSACDDGHSYERNDEDDFFSGWHCNAESLGCTPGRGNSTLIDINRFTFKLYNNSASYNSGCFYIEYWVPAGTNSSLLVYDDTGRRKAVIINDYNYCYNKLIWFCRDEENHYLSPGLYFFKLNMSGMINRSELYPVVITP